MPKRKPDQVIVHRIELQNSLQDQLELFVLAQQTNNLLSNVQPIFTTLTDPVKLYTFFTVLELLDLIDTPLPTLGDGNPVDLLKQWIQDQNQASERRDLNQEVQENLKTQAFESQKRAEKIRDDYREEYYKDPSEANKQALDNAQRELNRVQGEAKKRADIARGWNWKFRYENGRNPRTYEIMAAKIRGEWYGPS
jgi:hypothetical protein|tara:strand:- start:129 stop:713 length:585 start_codon:yes stop_codon:yes gene_type:complete